MTGCSREVALRWPLLLIGLTSSRCFAYTVREPTVSQLHPRGLRFSYPDEDGISLVAVHFSINKPLPGVEAGQVNYDIRITTGGKWVYENRNILVKPYDTVNYWIYVIYRGLGYQLLHMSWVAPGSTTITTVKPASTSSKLTTTLRSITKATTTADPVTISTRTTSPLHKSTNTLVIIIGLMSSVFVVLVAGVVCYCIQRKIRKNARGGYTCTSQFMFLSNYTSPDSQDVLRLQQPEGPNEGESIYYEISNTEDIQQRPPAPLPQHVGYGTVETNLKEVRQSDIE